MIANVITKRQLDLSKEQRWSMAMTQDFRRPSTLGAPPLPDDAMQCDDESRTIATIVAVHIHSAAIVVRELFEECLEKRWIRPEHAIERIRDDLHAKLACHDLLGATHTQSLATQVDDPRHSHGTQEREMVRARLSTTIDARRDHREASWTRGALEESERTTRLEVRQVVMPGDPTRSGGACDRQQQEDEGDPHG
jgi:hypothetical protein